MPRHESVEATLSDIFHQHKTFFDEMASDKYPFDAYRNAFMALIDKGVDVHHYEQCFESLRQASQEARAMKERLQVSIAPKEDELIVIGGETELRDALNKKLQPKTIARATLYNYLQELGIRKDTYTSTELDKVLQHILALKKERKDKG